jgi:hypothetical protein
MLTRAGLLLSVTFVLAGTPLAQAQSTPAPYLPPPVDVNGFPEPVLFRAPPPDAEFGLDGRVWARFEYLLWWVRNGPLNTPLVTTGSPTDAVPGALGQPGTQVLFGDRPLNYGSLSGIRLSAGYDLTNGFGLDAGYFALERSAVTFSAVSDGNGNPLIARPVFNNQGPAENAYLYALPGTAAGSVSVSSQSRLQGGELNLTANVYQDPSMCFTVFAGFRMVELDENLNVSGNVSPLMPGFLTFMGAAADPPNSYGDFDSFKIYNKFYGGQIGARFAWRRDAFDLGLVGKLALGSTQELFLVSGTSALNNPGNPQVTNPGGLLVQPSNMGRFFHSNFGVIPEIGVNLGYWVTPHCRLAFGYNFLYWNSVARPGDQIDRTVSASQVARDPAFGTNPGGDLRPVFQARDSSFWAQGMTFGVEFQY